MSSIKNVNLEISVHACKRVTSILSKNYKSKYKTLIKKLPTYILRNGLPATLAFLIAKSKGQQDNEHFKALESLINWLDKKGKLIIKDTKNPKFVNDLFDNLNNKNLKSITKESINYFVWQKRFVDGLIEDDKKDKTEESQK